MPPNSHLKEISTGPLLSWVQHAENKYYIKPGILSKYCMDYKYHIGQYNPKMVILYSEAAEWFRD